MTNKVKIIIMKFIGLRAKTYSHLIDDGSEDKEAKGIKKCIMKTKFELEILFRYKATRELNIPSRKK